MLEDPVEALGRQLVADPQPSRPTRAPRASTVEASSRLETLGNPDPLERVHAVRARAPRRRAAASGSPCRGCRALPGRTRWRSAREYLEVALGEHPRHRAGLVHPDAVLARERAARVEAGVEDRLGENARAPRSRRSRRRRARAGAGCRRPRGRRSRRAGRAPRTAPRCAAAPRAGASAGRRRPGRSSRSRSGPWPRRRTCGPSRGARGRRRSSRCAPRTRRQPTQILSTSAASSSTCAATPSSSTRSTAPAPAG